MIDLSEYPVVDSHCHAFLPEKEEEGFDQMFNLSTLSIPRLHTENTIFYRKVITELARVLGCSNDFEEVVKKRTEAYADPERYIQRLFREANIDTLLVDMGYPSEEYTGYSVPLDRFQNLVGCKVRCIYRIEPLLFKLFNKSLPFDELLRQYLSGIDRAVKEEGYVGLKSVIAYIYGLKIDMPDEHTAKVAYERLMESKVLLALRAKKTTKSLKDERILRSFLLCLAIKKSAELKVPFQIHTGIGDSPLIDIRDANPLHLFPIIKDEELKKAEVVIVHAGYPFVEEAGFLANAFPNVYADLSEMIPFIGTGMTEKVLHLLEMAPVSKIMYGSDGYNLPELHWIAAIWGKRSISVALQRLVDSDAMDEDYAYKAGKMILSENAVRLYKL